jgi:choline dehydrogenase
VPNVDVLIVGGGGAGCAMAARVAAAAPTASVLLLEAGPDIRGDAPSEVRDGWGMTRTMFDWGYLSEPGWFGKGRKVRRVKALGGTSVITRFAVRGAPADYDEWVGHGNPGWGWDGVLPFFRRAERDLQFGGQPWHGDAGPMPVNRYPEIERTEVHEAAIGAAGAIGIPAVADHNQPGAVGVGRMPMHSIDGRRVTAADAYLPPGSVPANLEIRARAEVDRVALRAGRATGVRLLDGSAIQAGLVVLCAGTYGSPAILLRSGVGPAADLHALRIDIAADLPGVGRNLSDHPATSLDAGFHGPWRESPIIHTIATFHSSGAAAGSPPDLMFWLADADPPDGDESQWWVEVVRLKPRCRGRVSLRSADPAIAPRIELPDPHDPADLDRLVEGVERSHDLMASEPLSALLTPKAPRPATRDAVIAEIEAGWYSIPHVVGTCAMGPSPRDGAVVDAAGRVHGIEGLFVVDASIIPTEPSGFTLFPTLMLAERLSAQVAAAAGRQVASSSPSSARRVARGATR